MNFPTMDWTILMPTIVVIVTGIAALIVEMLRPKQNNNLIVGVSLVGLAYAAILLFQQIGAPTETTAGGLVLRDQFAVLAQLITVGVTMLCFLFSEGYLREKRIAFGEFYPLAMWAASGGMMMASTHNMLMMFVGLEILSISLYCLAGMARREQRSEESALKYFLMGAFASAVLLYGIAFLFGASGTLDVTGFREAMLSETDHLKSFALIGLAMMIVGLGFKAALVPFHQWTPDVYQGAPTNVTAFMAAASKIAAFAGLYRVLAGAVDLQTYYMDVMMVLAILTMSIGNLVALVQKDVKRALGYSSIAHAGYIMVGLLAHLNSPEKISLGSVLFYLLSYSLMTVGAFAVITLTAKGGQEGTRTQDLNGMWKKAPLAAGSLLFFVVSLIGMPPTAGFFGKLFIFQDAWNSGLQTLAIALAINSVISVFYYLQIVRAAFVDDEDVYSPQMSSMSGGLRLTCILCIVGIGGATLFAQPILNITNQAGKELNVYKHDIDDVNDDVVDSTVTPLPGLTGSETAGG